jgi:hypothetical protein
LVVSQMINEGLNDLERARRYNKKDPFFHILLTGIFPRFFRLVLDIERKIGQVLPALNA